MSSPCVIVVCCSFSGRTAENFYSFVFKLPSECNTNQKWHFCFCTNSGDGVSNLMSTEMEIYSELRSCVKVEVAVVGSPSLVSPRVSVEVKQHWRLEIYAVKPYAISPQRDTWYYLNASSTVKAISVRNKLHQEKTNKQTKQKNSEWLLVRRTSGKEQTKTYSPKRRRDIDIKDTEKI